MSLNHSHIERLVAKAKAKDSQAFTQLYEYTYQKFYFVSFSILKNEHDAQDALQEAFIKILSSLHTLTDGKAFVSWGYRIVHNVSLRMLEKRRDLPTENDQLEWTMGDTEENSPLFSAIQDEKKRKLLYLIDNLDTPLRTSIILKYYQNMKTSEIALVMDCPEGTVKSRLNTAKKQLLRQITQEGGKDFFMGSFTLLPLSSILRMASGNIGIAPDKALDILTKTLDSNQCSTCIDFISTLSAASFLVLPFAPLASGVAVGTVATATITGTIALQLVSPTFHTINVPQTVVKSPATIGIEMKHFPKEGILYAVAPDGSKLVSTAEGKDHYTILIPDSGSYELFAIDKQSKTASYSINITTVDSQMPQLLAYSNTEETLNITVSDNLSGVDFNSIFLELTDGTKQQPIQIDSDAGTCVFHLPNDSKATLSISDLVGNRLESYVEIIKK